MESSQSCLYQGCTTLDTNELDKPVYHVQARRVQTLIISQSVMHAFQPSSYLEHMTPARNQLGHHLHAKWQQSLKRHMIHAFSVANVSGCMISGGCELARTLFHVQARRGDSLRRLTRKMTVACWSLHPTTSTSLASGVLHNPNSTTTAVISWHVQTCSSCIYLLSGVGMFMHDHKHSQLILSVM